MVMSLRPLSNSRATQVHSVMPLSDSRAGPTSPHCTHSARIFAPSALASGRVAGPRIRSSTVSQGLKRWIVLATSSKAS